MRKNVAGQIVGAQLVNALDGSAFTGAVTVHVTGDGGTQAVGSVGAGACTHEGNGFHTYAPAQAETNFNHIAFTFVGTGAIPITVQVYTESIDRHDTVRLGLTALPNAAANAAGGLPISIAGGLDLDAILVDTNELQADWADGGRLDVILDAKPTAVQNADELLKRDLAGMTGEAARSVLNAIRFLRNRWFLSGTTLTVTKEDDTTTAWTAVVTTNAAADPITGSDPA